MIREKVRTERLRRQRDLKRKYEAQLANAETDAEKKHLEARIAEVARNVKPVSLPEPIALIPETTKTAEDTAKKEEEHIVQPMKPKSPEPKRTHKKTKKVGSPF